MGRGARLSKHLLVLPAMALAAVPATAQNAAAPAPASSNTTSPAIVGTQLNDFNLNGSVTRQATPTTTTRPAPQPPQPTGATEQRPAQSAPAVRTPSRESNLTSADRAPPPSATPAAPTPQSQVQQPAQSPGAQAPVAALPATVLPGEAAPETTYWPWLLAALAAAGAAIFMFRRRQQQGRYVAAVAGADLEFDAGLQPDLPAAPLPRAVAAPPPKPMSTGIVSTRLHPDLAIDIVPERAIVDDHGATIEFQVAVRNHGSAPARDVRVEACMVNAGPAQDQELGAFFAHPANTGDPIPQILPMTEIMLKSAVRLKLDQMRQFDVGGRKLFVPLVGVNAVYRGPSGPAQTSASYLVGRDGKGEKMAPFRLDLGPKIFRGLGARQHTLGVHK